MFHCNSFNKSFDTRFGLNNHKHQWGYIANIDANVSFPQSDTVIAMDPNNNANASFIDVNNSNVNNAIELAKEVEIIQKRLLQDL